MKSGWRWWVLCHLKKTYIVKAGVSLVMQRIPVPMAMRAALNTTPARSPNLCIPQHSGMTKIIYMMVPQLTIRATVDGPQPGKAASMLSLMGPHVPHCKVCEKTGIMEVT